LRDVPLTEGLGLTAPRTLDTVDLGAVDEGMAGVLLRLTDWGVSFLLLAEGQGAARQGGTLALPPPVS
jgi:hypothetical protein